MAPTKCKTPSAPAITKTIVASLLEDSLKKKDEDARVAAAKKIKELVDAATTADEPACVELLTIAITLAGDNKSKNVREAADEAMTAFPAKLSEFAVRACLEPIFTGFQSQFWQSKMAALRSLDRLSSSATRKAVAACLPEIIPELAQVMVDMRDGGEGEVHRVHGQGWRRASATWTSSPFIPTLIECIHKVDEVPECVHKLAATTFVQQVEAPTLSIMGPLLQRGLFFQQTTAIKRKSAVIIDNMCKLVEDPMDAAPFLAQAPAASEARDGRGRGPGVPPGVHARVQDAAHRRRRVLGRRRRRRLRVEAHDESTVARSSRDDDRDCRARPRTDVTRCSSRRRCNRTLSTSARSPRTRSSRRTSTSRRGRSRAPSRTCALSSTRRRGDQGARREGCRLPYEASKKVFIVEDEEGEDLCKCDFSLAYGALILLNNATLHMKKGKRYGLCGPTAAASRRS